MVTGHLSTAYLARAKWPRAELVALLVASILPDLADFVLPQGNQCRTTCEFYTHAFPAFLVLAVAASGLAWAIWHRRATAILVGTLVCVHVGFDFFTGFKPFWFGGPPLGFGLYRYQALDFVVESLMVLTGWIVLRRSREAPRWAVHYATLVTLIAMQAAFDLWSYAAFGPPHARVAAELRPTPRATVTNLSPKRETKCPNLEAWSGRKDQIRIRNEALRAKCPVVSTFIGSGIRLAPTGSRVGTVARSMPFI